ncbi:MAG TPA: exodeoxyribonuclease III [Kofleriaceae bacterium]|nr:exodeoxyribonuclease III [Kofleriaceae bacterium]
MKLATWNINSIRAREERLLTWLGQVKPDVLCLQETKTEDAGFPFAALKKLGYEIATFGQRSYNGVAIASTQPLADVTRGFGDDVPDDEARVIAATTHGMRVVCVYVPNGQDLSSDRYPYKLAWFGRLRAYLERTSAPDQPLALCGDFNVTPDDRDVWSPEKWAGQIHVSQPERDALHAMAGFGLTDVFRRHNGDEKIYSWWDYRGVSFFKNQGLRIDLIYLTQPLVEKCTACTIDRNARKGQDASDHAPVIATIG